MKPCPPLPIAIHRMLLSRLPSALHTLRELSACPSRCLRRTRSLAPSASPSYPASPPDPSDPMGAHSSRPPKQEQEQRLPLRSPTCTTYPQGGPAMNATATTTAPANIPQHATMQPHGGGPPMRPLEPTTAGSEVLSTPYSVPLHAAEQPQRFWPPDDRQGPRCQQPLPANLPASTTYLEGGAVAYGDFHSTPQRVTRPSPQYPHPTPTVGPFQPAFTENGPPYPSDPSGPHGPPSCLPTVAPVAMAESKGKRASLACGNCRKFKAKCDEQRPCSLCEKKGLDCAYKDAQLKSYVAQKYLHPRFV